MRQAVISENLDIELCGDTVKLIWQNPRQGAYKEIDLDLVEAVRLRDWLNKELADGKP